MSELNLLTASSKKFKQKPDRYKERDSTETKGTKTYRQRRIMEAEADKEIKEYGKHDSTRTERVP